MKTLEERVYDADRANECLNNEAFQAAFEDIEEELTEAWKTSPQRDEEGRERLFLALTMLEKVKTCLETRLETGKLAKLELKHQKTLAEKARSLVGLS